ncbi:UNVERIFIED_CONTAM: Myosin-binding protein 7 [Sesamum angustifolium]|uniref:Myosin-binding protein 7 n=1 Tax=Sesamum angustifolium TaxID=2727405 RepID=A0AAW2MQT8_9LAMI
MISDGLQIEKAEIQDDWQGSLRCLQRENGTINRTLALEDLLYKREQTIESLTCEVQAYKHRMMSYGLTEAEAEGVDGME